MLRALLLLRALSGHRMAGRPVIADRVARFAAMTAPDRADRTLDEVIQRMLGAGASGRCESYIEVCRDMDVPSGRFLLWVKADVERYRAFNEALEMQVRLGALEAREIADGKPMAVMGPDGSPLFDEEGMPVVTRNEVARDKLRADVRFRLAAFHAPETYVERRELKVDLNVDLAARLHAARERIASVERPALEGVAGSAADKVAEAVAAPVSEPVSEATFL